MSIKPPPAEKPSPLIDKPAATARGSKLRARALLIGLGLLVLAYVAALVVRP